MRENTASSELFQNLIEKS